VNLGPISEKGMVFFVLYTSPLSLFLDGRGMGRRRAIATLARARRGWRDFSGLHSCEQQRLDEDKKPIRSDFTRGSRRKPIGRDKRHCYLPLKFLWKDDTVAFERVVGNVQAI